MMMEWQAGRELDAEIARKVFGHVVTATYWSEWMGGMLEDYWTSDNESDLDPVPAYSTEIAAAWLVMAWLRARFSRVELSMTSVTPPLVWVTCCDHSWAEVVSLFDHTEPLAICRAALAALEADVMPAPDSPTPEGAPTP